MYQYSKLNSDLHLNSIKRLFFSQENKLYFCNIAMVPDIANSYKKKVTRKVFCYFKKIVSMIFKIFNL